MPFNCSYRNKNEQGDVHEEIDLLCYLNVEDLKIGTLLVSTRKHPLVFGVVTGIIADALDRRHDVIVQSSPIGRMSKACIDVVPSTLTTHKVPLASAWHIRRKELVQDCW